MPVHESTVADGTRLTPSPRSTWQPPKQPRRAPPPPRRPGTRTRLVPRRLHRLRVTDLELLDLTTDGALDAVGLTLDDLRDDRTACQVVGNAVQYLGVAALRAPSATGVGDVIAVYEPHLRPGQLDIIDSTQITAPP